MNTYPGTLHAHTDHSNIRLRDCINKIPDLIDYAIELGHECVAITDHETISSFVQIEKYAAEIKEKHPNFKIIRGNEIYLTRNKLSATNFSKERGDGYFHFVLLAKDIIGYHQLCELSTRAWNRSYVSRRLRRVPTYYQDIKDVVGKNKGHIIASTACLGGYCPQLLLKYREEKDEQYLNQAKAWIQYINEIFGDGNFYLEMQPSNNQEQIFVNQQLLAISAELNIPYIITLDAHYLKKEDAYVHEKFLNAQDGEREVKSFYETTYMMDTKELEQFFPYFSTDQLQVAYRNIRAVAAQCEDYSIKRPLHIPQLPWLSYEHNVDLDFYCKKMPTLKVLLESPHEADKELVYAVIDGIKRHNDLQNDEAYTELEQCLDMTVVSSNINKAQWSAYFLNLQRIVDECWKAGTIVGAARGSGGGFLLLYCLDIIQMNKLREKTRLYPWRFLNPERVSVLDIDIDVSGLRRKDVLNHLRKIYGEDRICNVSTFRTEKSKSAILTAARGLDMPPEEGQYFASLIGAERGSVYSLSTMYYGDEDNDIKPNAQFVAAMTENPDLWRVAKKIEGLICGLGIHAGGVVFNDEPFINTCSLMRAPDGTIVSAFELHDLEELSLIKYDILSIQAIDKIQVCLDLLQEYGYVQPEATLKETYEKIIGVYNMEREAPEMWKMLWEHKIVSCFQMEEQSGMRGIELTHPKTVDELATLNSVIRLMAQKKGGETPIEKYARFRAYPHMWDEEMRESGLTDDERRLLHNELDISNGLSIAQEQFMRLVQIPEIGGMSFQWSDKLRKSIAKKNPKEYEKLTQEYYQNMEEKCLSKPLCHYVWDVLIAMNRSYGFNSSHTTAYSLIALQEMNLAYRYPILFWNTANLIVDSSGANMSDENDDAEELEAEPENDNDALEEEIVDIFEPEEWEDYEYEDLPDRSAKKKKKISSVNFGKIATAIGKFQSAGITITPPNINESGFTFTPIIERNEIASGLRNVTRISTDLVNQIIAARPFSSINEFQEKVKVNRLQMLSLLKCGAFDCIYPDRVAAIKEYLADKAGTKQKLTLANVPMLNKYGIFDEEAQEHCELYAYNRFIRKNINGDIIKFPNEGALNYYCEKFDPDLLIDDKSISVKTWEKLYKKSIAPLSDFIKDNMDALLAQLNEKLLEEQLDTYARGTISHYEIESMSFYYHEHELKNVNQMIYDICDFNTLSETPTISKEIRTKDGKNIVFYELYNICGTVLDKNKMKNTVTLLTPTGVVTVKIWKNQFAKYDKQISEIQPDGKKRVCEKSWFSRGTLLYLQGIRRGDTFVPKAYNNSIHRTPIMKILSVKGDRIVYTDKRYDEE